MSIHVTCIWWFSGWVIWAPGVARTPLLGTGFSITVSSSRLIKVNQWDTIHGDIVTESMLVHKVTSSYVIDTTRSPQTCSSTICPAQEQALRSMSCSKPDGGEAGNCNGAQLCHIAVAWKSSSYQKEKGTLSKKFLNICQPKSLHHDNLTTGTVLSSIRRVSYGWIILNTKDLYHAWSSNLPPFQSSPAWTSLPRSGFIIGIGLQLWHHMPPTSMPLRGSSKKNVVFVCPSIFIYIHVKRLSSIYTFIKYRFKFQWVAAFDRLTLVKEFSS